MGGQETCHPYGVLITIGDGTKPQNMSSQNMRGHSPFNGRGGFWRTSALKKVQFDHHTVGEDHDAAYRGFAYYGFKGILDNNMLCQEQEPPDCDSLVKQRIRWETAALDMEPAGTELQHDLPVFSSASCHRPSHNHSQGV